MRYKASLGFFWLLIWSIAEVVSVCFVIKYKKCTKKSIIMLSVAMCILYAISFLFPVENVLVSFDNPQDAFKYVHFEKIQLIVHGENSALVIGEKNESDKTISIIPKTISGWKVAVGYNSEKVIDQNVDGVYVSVYRLKDTEEYYVMMFDMQGLIYDVNHNRSSEIFSIKSGNHIIYYAYVDDLNEEYELFINNNQIHLEK